VTDAVLHLNVTGTRWNEGVRKVCGAEPEREKGGAFLLSLICFIKRVFFM
jgi:hypothetical protein